MSAAFPRLKAEHTALISLRERGFQLCISSNWFLIFFFLNKVAPLTDPVFTSVKWKVLSPCRLEKKNQQYHTWERVYLSKPQLFPTSQGCSQIGSGHPEEVPLTLPLVELAKSLMCHKKDRGNGAEWKQLDSFLYKAIIRKRNKLTALIWGMLNSDVRQTLVWTGKTLRWEIPTGNARDRSLYFYFWKVIFKNAMVLHTLQKQSKMNKEAKGEHPFWKPESFILYLFK